MQAQCLGMMTSSELASVQSGRLVPFTDQPPAGIGCLPGLVLLRPPHKAWAQAHEQLAAGRPALTCIRRNIISRAYGLAMS